ncbi:hypothetical protein [Streptomyces sp. NPDC001222]|uniref:hypothetical protein n=1 Tax=Streptomyces sp. NPDC001222 TaxID=3364548 RepID=UPI003690F0A9
MPAITPVLAELLDPALSLSVLPHRSPLDLIGGPPGLPDQLLLAGPLRMLPQRPSDLSSPQLSVQERATRVLIDQLRQMLERVPDDLSLTIARWINGMHGGRVPHERVPLAAVQDQRPAHITQVRLVLFFAARTH